MSIDQQLFKMVQVIFGLLISSSVISRLLKGLIITKKGKAVYENLVTRIRSWWVMMTILVVVTFSGPIGATVLFALISFLALREFITMTPTRCSDHRTLFWAFFVLLPYQYILVFLKWYGLFSVFIPVFAFMIVPVRSVLKDDCERFLERTAKIQWGLMICVYFISHIPALLFLDVKGFAGENAKLLLFLILVTQMSDIMQYTVGQIWGKTKIAPQVSPNKTVEGFIGGIFLASLFGVSLSPMTPFTPLQALIISVAITVTGFFGGLTMSAIKRDRGIKDYSSIISGHGGMLDRMDSLCFAAPLFFHIVRFYFT